MQKALVWESVSWRRGEEQYRFDVERGGLFATLSVPNGKAMTLPMVVWEGLVDALKAERATKTRGEQQQQYPSRSRSRWYEGEVAEVAEAFRAGRSLGEIAHAHNRSVYAIESQLDKLGLIDKAAIYGPGPDARGANNNSAAGQCGEDPGRWAPPPLDDETLLRR